MRNWIKTILILAVAILMVMPCTAQGDGGGKKKKKPVKTEQPQSSASKHKQREEARRKREEEAKRKQEAEAKRKREAEAKRQHEEEAQRQREAEDRKQLEEEAKRKQEEEAQRQREAEVRKQQEEEAKRKQGEEAQRQRETEDRKHQEEEAKRKQEEEARLNEEEARLNQVKETNRIMRNVEAMQQIGATIQNLINNMVYVEGGSFMMGSDDSEAWDEEKLVNQDTIGSFSIGKYEVTQKEWETVMGTNPSYFKGDDLPVECVSWDDCQEFISKLNAMTGKKFRLPTEAEWEYAASGGSNGRGYKFSGSDDINMVAWHIDNSGYKTHNVGTKAPNELGLYDMSGNVWEWTSSSWCSDYSKPRDASNFVRRGGSWVNDARTFRISWHNNRAYSSYATGLRLAL